MKAFLYTLFFLGLIYLLWPGPGSINDIPPIPNSLTSDEPGDTTQIPNVAAYFSVYKRDYITRFYYGEFNYLNILGFKIPPLRFNHPIEDASAKIRDQVRSTYLEEYVYPFRDSLFVNGYDKDIWNKLNHIKSDGQNELIEINGGIYNSKTTLRYYSSSFFFRTVVYIGIWVVLILLARLTFRAWKKY